MTAHKEKLEKKYVTEKAPDWVDHYTPTQLLEISQDDQKTTKIKSSGKGVCFLNNETVYTSDTYNQTYKLQAWSLSNSDTLQGISVNEILIKDNQYVAMHRLTVIRDTCTISKLDDLNVRVLSDEQSSSRGTIDNSKKVHFVIKDLHIGDVFIIEYSVITAFTEKNYLDKKYFRYIRTIPNGYWYYRRDFFKIINRRSGGLKVSKKYFRNESGNVLPTTEEVIEPGKDFVHEQLNLQLEFKDDIIPAFIDATSLASWEEISSFQLGLRWGLMRLNIQVAILAILQ